MATELVELQLEELSLVDRPANAEAMVSLFKRDQEKDTNMTNKTNEVDKSADFEAEIDELKAENEFLRKSLIEAGYVIKSDVIEKKVEPEYVEYEGEQINKADIPAPILKALEAAEVAKADAELTEKAKEALPHFNIDVAKSLVGEFAEVEAVMETLKAADKVFAESMEEVGKSDADGEFATASDKLETLVKSYMDENKLKKSQYAVAYAAVAKTEEGKALINKSYKGE